MSKINLIPEVALEKVKIKKLNFAVTLGAIVVVGVVFLMSIILLGYKLSRTQSINSTEDRISETKESLKEYEELESTVISLESGINAINNLATTDHKWSIFLPHLEKITPNDVRFIDFNQEGNTFKASAEGKTVNSIGRLVNSLEDYILVSGTNEGSNLFKNVAVQGYTRNSDGSVAFGISFEIEGGILW